MQKIFDANKNTGDLLTNDRVLEIKENDMIDKIHLKNLNELIDLLISLPEENDDFSMSKFFYAKDNETYIRQLEKSIENKKLICGTSACALGHALISGIGESPKRTDFNTIDWDEYSLCNFGIIGGSIYWKFLFSQEWQPYDNTTKGAAQRIKKYILDPNSITAKNMPWYEKND